jgi:hypothetical protein
MQYPARLNLLLLRHRREPPISGDQVDASCDQPVVLAPGSDALEPSRSNMACESVTSTSPTVVTASFSSTIAVAAAAIPAAASAEPPSCNWGHVTSEAIAGGFDQGGHASSFAGSKRVGLPNILGTGDLNATCEFVSP